MSIEKYLAHCDEADYMNAEQLAYFRELLESMRDNLTQPAPDEGVSEGVRASDVGDIATNIELAEMGLKRQSKRIESLRQVLQALDRIDDENYGYCEQSGEPIGLRRLIANPCARYTIEVQQHIEQKNRLYA